MVDLSVFPGPIHLKEDRHNVQSLQFLHKCKIWRSCVKVCPSVKKHEIVVRWKDFQMKYLQARFVDPEWLSQKNRGQEALEHERVCATVFCTWWPFLGSIWMIYRFISGACMFTVFNDDIKKTFSNVSNLIIKIKESHCILPLYCAKNP